MGCLLGHHNKSLREVMAPIQHQPPTDYPRPIPKTVAQSLFLTTRRWLSFAIFFFFLGLFRHSGHVLHGEKCKNTALHGGSSSLGH
ncbi:hypothetical protein K402DRAFT_102797 [Aulographum hederae CBS 113979]|uniref:Uncharacterized protein n=1 Tax=Aulographum hederae CBS 113979 TaxID=1176131 RepID=A0A6G1GY47_9PEZI|nr:hypothetical protein K402DRAFT_102797 [Aulographum hederae CBS 113979]